MGKDKKHKKERKKEKALKKLLKAEKKLEKLSKKEKKAASVKISSGGKDSTPDKPILTDKKKKSLEAVKKTSPSSKSLAEKKGSTDSRSAKSSVSTTPSLTIPRKLKILFVASECAPFAKVGGLADVVAALPKALVRLGHDVRIIMPLYSSIDREKYGLTFKAPLCVHMGGGEENWAGLYEGKLDGEVPVWFLEYNRFYDRNGIYNEPGRDDGDNGYRYAMLSKAALQACKDHKFIPHIMHVHDWPSALGPVFLKTWDRILSPLSRTASVLTIHNAGHQGVFDAACYRYIGTGDEHFTANKFEDHGRVNLLKAGLWFADAITAVSPTYAREILTADGGFGLAPYFNYRRDDLTGILNGVDYDHWNPETDTLIPANYSVTDQRGKAICKSTLQQKFGLLPNPDQPVFGIVSRFAHQKGFNLMQEALPLALRDMVIQLVVLGNGDPQTEDFFRRLVQDFPGRVGGYIGYSNELSHLIEAGSDFFLMPSLYEPCGLNQIYSLRYGTVPIVRDTGGLADTVENYDENSGTGTGFKFVAPTPQALYDTMGWAVSTWYDRPHHYDALRANGMSRHFPWETAAGEYVKVYHKALQNRWKEG